MGRRSWDRRRRADRAAATCCSVGRRASASGSTRRCGAMARAELDAARRLALALDQTTLAIQGPPGSGKTYTRCPDDLLAPRAPASGSASPARATRSSATSSGRSSRRPRRGGRRPSRPEGRHGPGPRGRSGAAAQGRRRMSGHAWTTAAPTWPPAPPGCGRREDGRGRRRPVRGRSRPDLAGQRHRDAHERPTASSCSATRSSSTSRSRARIRRARIGRHSRTSLATPRPCPRRAASSSRRPGASIRTCATSPPRCSTTTVWSRRRTSSASGSRPAERLSTAQVHAASTSRRSAADNESPEEADAVAELAMAIVDGGAMWIDEQGSADRWAGRHPHRRAVQRAGRRDHAPAAARGARVGTVDKFQGQEAPISDLLDDDLVARARAARDGLPVQPPPTERGDVAGALRRDRRRRRRPVAGARPNTRADAPGQCVLPVRRAGLSLGGSGASGRSARLSR